MTEPTSDSDDHLDGLLRAARPSSAAPDPDVRRRHRAELGDRIAAGPARRRALVGWRPAAAVVVVAVLAAGAALVAQRGDGRAQITAGPADSRTGTLAPTGPPLTSTACGGSALPFEVPVAEHFGARTSGPVPGAPGPDVEGQLVAHWRSADTAIEVRWPADASQSFLDALDLTRGDIESEVARGMSATQYTGADLSIDVVADADGATAGPSISSRSDRDLDGSFTIAVTRSQQPPPSSAQDGPRPVWGAGLCSTVQLTVRALDGRSDVRADAEALYDRLMTPGGPLLPAVEPVPLVVARTDATSLAPPSRCDVPAGIDQDPIKAEPLDGPGPFPTADAALAAYLDTTVRTEEGPFGPQERPGAPTGGYTAISLPDGRVAFRWPDQGGGVVGYFYAEQGPDGWAITRTEGPSC